MDLKKFLVNFDYHVFMLSWFLSTQIKHIDSRLEHLGVYISFCFSTYLLLQILKIVNLRLKLEIRVPNKDEEAYLFLTKLVTEFINVNSVKLGGFFCRVAYLNYFIFFGSSFGVDAVIFSTHWLVSEALVRNYYRCYGTAED